MSLSQDLVESTSRAALPVGPLIGVLEELAGGAPPARLYQRYLELLVSVVPADAVALLRHEGGGRLVPVALHGLQRDALGRHFRLDEHPRLRAIWEGEGITRFPADAELPDPWDGLLLHDEHLLVHDCLGATLTRHGEPWGLVTVDALAAGSFDATRLEQLRLLVAVGEAVVTAGSAVQRLQRQRDAALAETHAPATEPRLVGESAPMAQLDEHIRAVADSDLTVLVQGETGTGKELVARALHRQSARADGPLVTVNAAALPEGLVESELFGHRKGAFTGATESRRGKFELADGGTLFLDEVGELAPAVQARLLRVLQDGDLQPLGEERPRRVDVRVIAATNRDLAAEVAAGRFRADLYHRLSVYPVVVPPLRERGDDVLLLAGHFAEQVRARLGLRALRLDPACTPLLQAYHWPGNVRELEHVIHRAAVLARHRTDGPVATIEPPHLHLTEDLPAGEGGEAEPEAPLPTLREGVEATQRRLINEAHHRAGSWAGAARLLGVDPGNLTRLRQRLGMG